MLGWLCASTNLLCSDWLMVDKGHDRQGKEYLNRSCVTVLPVASSCCFRKKVTNEKVY